MPTPTMDIDAELSKLSKLNVTSHLTEDRIDVYWPEAKSYGVPSQWLHIVNISQKTFSQFQDEVKTGFSLHNLNLYILTWDHHRPERVVESRTARTFSKGVLNSGAATTLHRVVKRSNAKSQMRIVETVDEDSDVDMDDGEDFDLNDARKANQEARVVEEDADEDGESRTWPEAQHDVRCNGPETWLLRTIAKDVWASLHNVNHDLRKVELRK